MTYDEFRQAVAELFPNAMVDEDLTGQLVISTGLQCVGPEPLRVIPITNGPPEIGDIIDALQSCGADAQPGMCGPTDIEIRLAIGRLLLARDFNATGWEAVYEPDPSDCVQIPLKDGPGSNDASVTEVVEWAEALAANWEGNVA